MLIYDNETGIITTDRPATHLLVIRGEEKIMDNAYSGVMGWALSEVEEVEKQDLLAYSRAEYEAKVTELIRERYTLDQELAIMRKMKALEMMPSVMAADDSGTGSARADEIETEFINYNTWAEECKILAKEILTAQKLKKNESCLS